MFLRLRFIRLSKFQGGDKWWVIKVWQNGVQTSNLVMLGQWVIREVAHWQQPLQRCRWMISQYLPCSPDLALSDLHRHRVISTGTKWFPHLSSTWGSAFWPQIRQATAWKQLLQGCWNHMAQNPTRHELTNQYHNWTNASSLVGSMLKNKVRRDNTCYLLHSKWQYALFSFCNHARVLIYILKTNFLH